MGADAHGHQVLGLDGAVLILGVIGNGVILAVGVGIGQLRFRALEAGEHVGGAANNPDGLAAPLNNFDATGGDVGNVDLHRSASRAGLLGGGHGAHEGDGGCGRGHTTGRAAGNHPVAARGFGALGHIKGIARGNFGGQAQERLGGGLF